MPRSAADRYCDENDEAVLEVVARLETYQPRPVTRANVVRWLAQFANRDHALALRLLQATEFYDVPRLQGLLRVLHRAVGEQLRSDGIPNLSSVVFSPLGRAGESGQAITAMYRNVNHLRGGVARIVEILELRDLIYDAEKKGQRLVIVFIDDFIGSGTQISGYWREFLSQIVPPTQTMYVATAVATPRGASKVVDETPLRVVAAEYTGDASSLITSPVFTHKERRRLHEYCTSAGNLPLGFKELELMLAFAHGSPNNTLAILRGSQKQRPWFGILPRFEDLREPSRMGS